MRIYIDEKHHFYELFNETNGTLVRSNVSGTNEDAKSRDFPELIDIGIMGSCKSRSTGMCARAGVDCYQVTSSSKRPDMSFEEYEWIIQQCRNKVFQVALGGAGDPNKHQSFERILKVTKENGIVPNLTTSGYQLSEKEVALIREYCGAVAVSYYSRLVDNRESNPITCDSVEKFINAGCITNIHFIISNETIDEAIFRLENDIWPRGISAIIFILYKPVGFGIVDKMVKDSEKLKHFIELALNKRYSYRIGFDTCFTSALCRYERRFSVQSIDACEAARFSMYIDSELNAYPCSFDNQFGKYKVPLKLHSIQEAWDSKLFDKFRDVAKKNCINCKYETVCNNGCHLELGIDLC